MRNILLEEYIDSFLGSSLIKEMDQETRARVKRRSDRWRAIEQELWPDAFDEEESSEEESSEEESSEDNQRSVRFDDEESSEEEITWGDLISAVRCKINSKRSAKIAKFMFRIIGGVAVEEGVSIGAEGVEKSLEATGKISKAIVSYTSEALEETSSNVAFSASDLNKKLKRFFKKIGKSSVETLAGVLLACYRSNKSNRNIKNSDLKYLVIDEKISEIIEDEIETEFLKDLSKQIIDKVGNIQNKKIKNLSINDLLHTYLISNYENRTVTGYEE